MSGIKIAFDTNALIYFLSGHPALEKYSDSDVVLSIISIIEFLSFSKISEKDKNLLNDFLEKVSVVELTLANAALLNQAAGLRKSYKLKLPDAVIAATAMLENCELVSNDKKLDKIADLTIIRF